MDSRIYREVWALLDRLQPPEAPLESWEKAPAEWVTDADLAIEASLSPRLEAILPGSHVVGEESSAGEAPAVRISADPTWLVDPIDGTANFVSGGGPYATMVALVTGGRAAGAWTVEWRTGDRLGCWPGLGVFVNGSRLERKPDRLSRRGVLSRRFLPEAAAARLESEISGSFEIVGNSGCAATDYRSLLLGEVDFLLYERTLPWDHAPGVAMVQSLGGFAIFGDGSPWRPASEPGLVVSFSHEWARSALAARAAALAAG